MKHVFLLNPVAGTKKFQRGLAETIQKTAANHGLDYEIHITTGPGDARDYTAGCHSGEDVRFYAIGGDGTLNEAVNGILRREGYSELALIPCGTGDDFVRVFPKKAPYLDLDRQITTKATPIDVIGTDLGVYGINMVNIGIDAQTAADVHRFSHIFPGTLAYVISLINRLMHKLGIPMKLTIDGHHIIEGNFILTAFANGRACGGGFFASPKAEISDGLLEITAVKKLTRLQFVSMVKGYKDGTHLDDPRYKDFIHYCQGKKVTLETPAPTKICIDGEIFETNTVTAELLPKALNFVVL